MLLIPLKLLLIILIIQQLLQLERRKEKYGLNTWITNTHQMGYNSYGPILRGVISVLNSLKLPNSQ